jgi:hypothetical protein
MEEIIVLITIDLIRIKDIMKTETITILITIITTVTSIPFI